MFSHTLRRISRSLKDPTKHGRFNFINQLFGVRFKVVLHLLENSILSFTICLSLSRKVSMMRTMLVMKMSI